MDNESYHQAGSFLYDKSYIWHPYTYPSRGVNMLIANIFWVLSIVISSFTLLPALICIVFAIPTTKRLERANMLHEDNPIIKRYWISIGLLLFEYLFALFVTYFIDTPHAYRGFIGGTVFAFIIGIWKIGKNKNNIDDYVKTQSSHFSKPIYEVVSFIANTH